MEHFAEHISRNTLCGTHFMEHFAEHFEVQVSWHKLQDRIFLPVQHLITK